MRSSQVAGKVIAITGANGGLGRAMARKFAGKGVHVVLLGRSAKRVQAIADELGENATAIGCDVTSPDSVEEAFSIIGKTVGKIDVLINNAAIFSPMPIEEASADFIVEVTLANLAGPMLCVRAAVPLIPQGGQIISISSESVDLPFPYLLLYQATKAGLEKFALNLNAELADKGIRSSIVRAGQMFGEGMSGEVEPAIGARFFEIAARRGLDLMQRGATSYESAAQAVLNVVASPPDMHVDMVSFHSRPVS